MSGFIDIYVLSPVRSTSVVESFLNHFLPLREEAALDYWVQIGDINPVKEFESVIEMCHFCEMNADAESRAYWRNRTEGVDPYHAHVFFLPKGGLVLGLSIAQDEETDRLNWLSKLKAFAQSEIGYCALECAPAPTIEEFVFNSGKPKEYVHWYTR
jgi:hypothetical protein